MRNIVCMPIFDHLHTVHFYIVKLRSKLLHEDDYIKRLSLMIKSCISFNICIYYVYYVWTCSSVYVEVPFTDVSNWEKAANWLLSDFTGNLKVSLISFSWLINGHQWPVNWITARWQIKSQFLHFICIKQIWKIQFSAVTVASWSSFSTKI